MKMFGVDLSKLKDIDDKENAKFAWFGVVCMLACVVSAVYFLMRVIGYFIG